MDESNLALEKKVSPNPVICHHVLDFVAYPIFRETVNDD